MKLKPIAIIIFFVLIASIVTFKKYNVSQKSDNTLVIGTAAGYAPFVSINQYGSYEGFDVDVARALAQEMGKELVIQDLGSMTSLFTALEQDKIDAIIWGLSITQDRLKKVALIHYQGESTKSYPLIFLKTIPTNVRTIADMNGKMVCVEPTSSQDTVLSKNLSQNS